MASSNPASPSSPSSPRGARRHRARASRSSASAAACSGAAASRPPSAFVALFAAVPPARSTGFDWLGLGGDKIERVRNRRPAPTTTPLDLGTGVPRARSSNALGRPTLSTGPANRHAALRRRRRPAGVGEHRRGRPASLVPATRTSGSCTSRRGRTPRSSGDDRRRAGLLARRRAAHGVSTKTPPARFASSRRDSPATRWSGGAVRRRCASRPTSPRSGPLRSPRSIR